MPTMPMSTQRANLEISKRRLLLVEGKDEEIFFDALYRENNQLTDNLSDIQIIPVNGKDNFKFKLLALTNTSGFDIVTSLAIIRDADSSADDAFKSIKNTLIDCGLPFPSDHGKFSETADFDDLRIGIFIMPGDNNEGTMLEDLCLNTKSDHPAMPYIDSFFQNIAELDIPYPSNKAKAKCQVYLACMHKIVNNLGLGAQKGYWDLNNDCLKTLIDFLKEL
ncbi:DUF3226 domain-containing protein [Sporolactobacillus sp. STCC-11]|uniref:DUF3226 domain-containing protein n=1 Tax=Sporolactobacillus caesalpiniae TaxID=3230362 RepID=UPI003390EFAD